MFFSMKFSGCLISDVSAGSIRVMNVYIPNRSEKLWKRGETGEIFQLKQMTGSVFQISAQSSHSL